MAKTTFRIDIGDWSGDGHGQKESYMVSANKTIEEVRDAYFAACKKLPECLCPENFMSDYEDYSLPKDTYEEAKKLGFDFLKGFDDVDTNLEERLQYPDFGTEEMCDYVIWFLEQGDPELKLKKAPDVDTLAFYGADSKKRHIGFIGYGLLGN